MPKSKSKTVSKSKQVRKGRKSSKKKFKIPKPPNIRKLDDDTVIIQNFSDSKTVSGSFRKSFHELTKEDLDREYSATIDYKPNTADTIHQVDIQRGWTRHETDTGRASVNSRVDRNDEITMHNHPDTDDIEAKWTRPSGADINNVIYLKDEGYNLKASYIKSADGRFIRYKVVDMYKAKRGSRLAKDEYYAVITESEKKKYMGYIDWKIEQEYHRIYMNEVLLSLRLNKPLTPEEDQKQFILEKQAIQEAEAIETDPNLTQRQKDVKIQEMSSVWLKRMNKFDKKHKRKNPKFIPDKTDSRKRELMIRRRAFNEWSRYMLYQWGVEVKRMPKGFKYPIKAGE